MAMVVHLLLQLLLQKWAPGAGSPGRAMHGHLIQPLYDVLPLIMVHTINMDMIVTSGFQHPVCIVHACPARLGVPTPRRLGAERAAAHALALFVRAHRLAAGAALGAARVAHCDVVRIKIGYGSWRWQHLPAPRQHAPCAAETQRLTLLLRTFVTEASLVSSMACAEGCGRHG